MPRTSTAVKQQTNTKSSSRQASNSNRNSGSSSQSRSFDAKLQKLFVDSLKDIYWAEKHLVKALIKMQKSATSEELQAAFADHAQVTETHAERLEQIFEILGETARGKKCEAMEGLIEEGKTIIEETDEGTATRDVGLIMAAQKVEHYEIASYGCLAQLARTLGHTEVADILETTLTEEKDTDVLLTDIAENNVNYEASEEGEDE